MLWRARVSPLRPANDLSTEGEFGDGLLLKQGFTIYLEIVTSSPPGRVFGPIIGLLLFANLVSRYLLFITAWTATARENIVPRASGAPPPAVISPRVVVRKGPTARGAVGLLGVGAVLGLLLGRRKRPPR